MLTSQSWTPKTSKTSITITNPRIEVGDDYHGICVRISQKEEREWCNIGHHRLPDKIHVMPTYKDDRFGRQICQDIHK